MRITITKPQGQEESGEKAINMGSQKGVANRTVSSKARESAKVYSVIVLCEEEVDK